ncbi:replication-associated recombination protein A [Acidipropionibacterium jensenii]|uniref:replication-associated recombination protein A n=1 Tax=Acidipropionibacterium jensenii TaxID=1749 RepID=UPI00214CF68E|nr:replication-associated recombination protein A [Acidipropionibacterium jensenii]
MTTTQPLAARMRPTSLDDIVGQDRLTAPGSSLRLLADGSLSISVILYGPPGSGKTSIADAIAHETGQRFVTLSATAAGVKDVRKVLADARAEDRGTVVFIDEIHRFSRTQQDVLLPAVEDGAITLIGATTENPSFSVNSALVSRSILVELSPIDIDDIANLIRSAMLDERGFDDQLTIDEHAVELIARLASGDARQALTRLETVGNLVLARGGTEITPADVEQATGRALQRFDRDGDQHYDIVSAFIKSMRGSDPDAALYWLARLIEGGEDPRFIARRLIVHASEDVGMADPTVLPIAVAAAQAVQLIGMPEARINLAQATVAIATAPKSNAILTGIDRALADVRSGHTGPVPDPLRDAHYPGAAALGHGAGYRYPHDYPHHVVAQQYLPDAMSGTTYYRPSDNGHEATITRRMNAVHQFVQKH